MNHFSVGNVLGRSFSIWFKNLIPFTLLTIIVYSPLVIYTMLTLSGDLTLEKIMTWGYVVAIGGFVLDMIVTGALVYGVFQQLRGKHASIGEAIVVGVKRMFPILGVGLLVGLCVLGGFIALIVPGIIIACMLWLAVPVAVVERPGVFASLKRSRELTNGVKGGIFGILLVLGLLEKAVGFVLEKGALGTAPTISSIKLYLALVLIVTLLLGTLGAVANAVAYHDIRKDKEGIGVDDLVKVFE